MQTRTTALLVSAKIINVVLMRLLVKMLSPYAYGLCPAQNVLSREQRLSTAASEAWAAAITSCVTQMERSPVVRPLSRVPSLSWCPSHRSITWCKFKCKLVTRSHAQLTLLVARGNLTHPHFHGQRWCTRYTWKKQRNIFSECRDRNGKMHIPRAHVKLHTICARFSALAFLNWRPLLSILD